MGRRSGSQAHEQRGSRDESPPDRIGRQPERFEGEGAEQSGWVEVPPLDRIRDAARRLVAVHDLRVADAVQLAGALTASANRPETLPFVTLDERLGVAARREGFRLLP